MSAGAWQQAGCTDGFGEFQDQLQRVRRSAAMIAVDDLVIR